MSRPRMGARPLDSAAVTLPAPLVLERFGRRYNRRRPWAVRDVSLTVAAGGLAALIGPNGAGKSTILRACLGFERPDEGRVLVFGHDAAVRRAAAVAHVAYVPQVAALYNGLTIRDHLDLAQAARSAFDPAVARSRLAALDLDEERRVGHLSGGEQAQVALALALGLRAPLLILDEPLASLDPLARREFLTTLVEDVRTRGATAILSSHIVADVEQMCDRLLVLSGGRLVLDDTVAGATTRTRTVRLSELNGQSPIGVFAGPTGELLAITDDPYLGRKATVEEIVLGYLASGRSASQVERLR